MRQALLHTVRNPCYSHTAAVTTAPAGHFSSSSSWPRCETPHSCRTGLLSAAGPQRLRVPVRLSRLSTSAQAPPSTTSAAADHPASTSQHSSAAPAQHTPVLLSEVLGFFADLQLRSFVDGTLGAGGHACAIATAHQVWRLSHPRCLLPPRLIICDMSSVTCEAMRHMHATEWWKEFKLSKTRHL